MIIPKAERRVIYETLFKDGVLVAKKDFEVKHEEIDVRNLYVIKAMQSLTSRGFVKTQFSWQVYYYTLTNEGVEYLREFLGVPEGIVPTTQLEAPIPTRPQPQRSHNRRNGDDSYRKRTRD